MEAKTYDVQLRRHRGRWEASVPALPRDAPRVVAAGLGNVAPDMIVELSSYLGVDPSTLSVRVPHPVRPVRRRLRERATHGVVQLAGAVVGLIGLYVAAGPAATLIASGVGVAAVATGKEAGWL
jgi:hypothetical protein